MARLGYIDPSKVIITIGPYQVEGYAKGEFAAIKFNSDQFTLIVGSGGDGSRAKSNDRSARITLKLLQTAAANSILMTAFRLDQASGITTFPFSLTDLANAETYLSTHTWISKIPDASFSNEDVAREWTLETHDLEPILVPRI